MRRRSGLIFLGLCIALPLGAQGIRPLGTLIPMLKKDLLPEVNRYYRRAGLKSRVVFMGNPQIQDQQLRIRFIERWPRAGALATSLVDRQISLEPVGSQWVITRVDFQVQALPAELAQFGPTARQLRDDQVLISDQTLATPGLEDSDGPFTQALNQLLKHWQGLG